MICGRRIAQRSLAVFVGAFPARLDEGQDQVWTSIEPPAHETCAAYSLLTCPHLNKRAAKVQIATSRTYMLRKRIVRRTTPDGHPLGPLVPLDTSFRLGTVDIYAAVLDERAVRVAGADQWLAVEAPAQYRALAEPPVTDSQDRSADCGAA